MLFVALNGLLGCSVLLFLLSYPWMLSERKTMLFIRSLLVPRDRELATYGTFCTSASEWMILFMALRFVRKWFLVLTHELALVFIVFIGKRAVKVGWKCRWSCLEFLRFIAACFDLSQVLNCYLLPSAFNFCTRNVNRESNSGVVCQ